MAILVPLFVVSASLAGPPPPSAPPSGGVITQAVQRRVVKRFDFDETAIGNYESIPKNWRMIREPGFPRYLEASFDDKVGHAAPPSFRFPLQGGSLGATYLAKDIHVQPDNDYRVSAWIRTQGLSRAGAHVRAYYLDHALRRIDVSARSSPIVIDSPSGPEWREVVIDLPGGIEEARWIGLECFVEQPPPATPTPTSPRPIRQQDFHGSAWFDDIVVLRLPRARLEVTTPKVHAAGNVFAADEKVVLDARVIDPDGVGLICTLTVRDFARQVVRSWKVEPSRADEAGASHPLSGLDAGYYEAELMVSADDAALVRRTRRFALLAGDPPGGRGPPSRIGVIITDAVSFHSAEKQRLVRLLRPGLVKVPLWRSSTTDEAIVFGDRGLDAILQQMAQNGVEIVAVLEAPPRSLAESLGPPNNGLLDALTATPSIWHPYLALLLARHGYHIRNWQLGTDAAPPSPSDERLDASIANLRGQLSPLVNDPKIILPRLALEEARSTPITGVQACVTASALPRPSDRGEMLKGAWVTLETPDPARYGRDARLASIAQRLIESFAGGAERVRIDQPWREAAVGDAVEIEPTEDFVALRTIGDVLGGLTRARPVWIDHGVRAWLFTDAKDETGALAAWTDGDAGKTRTCRCPIGDRAEQIDVFGNRRPTGRVDGGRTFEVGSTPTLIAPVDVRHALLQTGFAVAPPTLQPSIDGQERTLRLTNPYGSRLRARLRLRWPEGWNSVPEEIEVELDAGAELTVPLLVHVPTNQRQGDFELNGWLLPDVREAERLHLRCPLRVETPGLGVNVMALRDDGRLHILHRLTNASGRELSLRVRLVSRDAPTQSRTHANVAPGQHVVSDFWIDRPESLKSGYVRVTTEEIDGPIVHNDLIELAKEKTTGRNAEWGMRNGE